MKKLLLLFLFSGFLLNQLAAQEFTLDGELKSFKPIETIYFSYNNGDTRIFDSVEVRNGRFQLSGEIIEPVIVFMSVKYKRKPGDKMTDDVLQFYLEPANMKLAAIASLKNAKITGSKAQADYEKIRRAEKAYAPRLEKLQNQYAAARRAKNERLIKEREQQLQSLKQEYAENVYAAFLQNNPETPIGLYIVNMYRTFEPEAEKAAALFTNLPLSLQQLPSGVDLKKRIEVSQKTAIGNDAMDFTQNDTLGNPVKLSSFKGKYVLLDFWASWCKPCRAENPNLVKAYNKFKDKNFTILGVSLDAPNGKERWLKAIHDDGLTWTHVSDLKFWNNAVAKLYGISSVPQNFLINPEGKIVAKNLRGEELEQKLAELMMP